MIFDPYISYDIVSGQLTLSSHAALKRFQRAGGEVKWVEQNNFKASAIFRHKTAGEKQVTWYIDHARQLGLTSLNAWRKNPSVMLSNRVIAEGVRSIYPECLEGFLIAEEVKNETV